MIARDPPVYMSVACFPSALSKTVWPCVPLVSSFPKDVSRATTFSSSTAWFFFGKNTLYIRMQLPPLLLCSLLARFYNNGALASALCVDLEYNIFNFVYKV